MDLGYEILEALRKGFKIEEAVRIGRNRMAFEFLSDAVGSERLNLTIESAPLVRKSKAEFFRLLHIKGNQDLNWPVKAALEDYKRVYLKALRRSILEKISELREGIRLLTVTRRTCGILRDLIDTESPMFTVSEGRNFVGGEYFRFRFCDSELFGVVV